MNQPSPLSLVVSLPPSPDTISQPRKSQRRAAKNAMASNLLSSNNEIDENLDLIAASSFVRKSNRIKIKQEKIEKIKPKIDKIPRTLKKRQLFRIERDLQKKIPKLSKLTFFLK